MKKTIYLDEFRQSFTDYNRKENFSYEGLEILYNSLTEFEQTGGDEIELDVIALCCEYSESTEKEIKEYYNIIGSVEKYLEENTFVCGKFENENQENVFIYQQF